MPFFDNPMFVSLLMVLWGIAVKYLPQLKEFPNRAIWVCNIVIGILAKLVAPDPAHASFFGDLGHSLGWFVVPLQTILARQIYESFIRPTLEQFGMIGHPATPVDDNQPKQLKVKK